ncbi:MAG: hypothetical protein MI717_02665 [Spirochaetales bacterium]|nr:hypothetical protein [Spirochaetales bacterium]
MREPTLLIPYAGPDASGKSCDVFVYLRPETNGVVTESVMMKTILSRPQWSEGVKLVYMANYPGDFIRSSGLLENHYRLKISFARRGGALFTARMRHDFTKHFGCSFEAQRVLGAFDFVQRGDFSEEDLFAYRVDESDMLVTLGQNVKRYGDEWIVNYDIPAILQKNTSQTDIAVMVFRVSMDWDEFRDLMSELSVHLVEAGILDSDAPVSRVLHHSKSPWEQLLDGMDFLWGKDAQGGCITSHPEGGEDHEGCVSFGAYMLARGHSRQEMMRAISQPLIQVHTPQGEQEENLFEASEGLTYAAAAEIWDRCCGQLSLSG